MLVNFFIYGLIRPVILGYQGLMLSVKASKSFLTYAFAAYMIVCCKKINFKKLFSFLLFLSLYYSVLYIIAVIIPIGNILLGFEKTGYIQCLYDSFIYFSICYVCSVYFEGGVKKRIFYIGILIIGIFLGGYFSMFGCSIVVVVYSIYLKATARYSINARRFIGIILLFLLLCIVFAMFKFGYFNEIVSTQTAAIDSRGKNNLVREYLIAKEIYFGYGFISQNSSYIQGMMQDGNQYAQSLSFVDSGYIDLLGKFGIVGTLFFLMIPFIFIKKMKLREDNMFVVLLISFYAINATWAVLCYPMGVIIIGIIFGFLIKNIKSDRNEQIKKLVGSK